MKKFKKPNIPIDKTRLSLRRQKSTEEKTSDALAGLPRITNETVVEHREEVLGSARKYIYPLQHSKHRVVKISVGLLLLLVVGFLAFTGLSLYRFQSTSGFMHDVTRIIPFPVAKAGDKWVGYESYLFELRRNMHYYRTQQNADFSTKEGQDQLKYLKRQAMAAVVEDAYAKTLAERNGITVTDEQVEGQLALVRSQNRLGSNTRVFKDVLKEFWGWSEADFERALRQQMLKQAVVSKLDTKTRAEANGVLKQLQSGGDFSALAGQFSDDPATKGNGGQYPNPVTPNDREVPPRITAEIFKLQPNQLSPVVESGYTLEIIKVLEKQQSNAKAAHIQFNLENVNTFVKPLQDKEPSRQYIRF